MKSVLIAIAALTLPLGLAWAQPSTATTPKSTTTAKKTAAPAKKASTTRKPVTKARASAPAKTAKIAESATLSAPPSEHLSDTELAIAKKIDTGTIACELGAQVTVTADEKNPGFFRISSGKQSYYMRPVESRTGAIRLEDARAGALWLQLGNKSMLMNQKLGQRVADECASPMQRELAAQLKNTPQPTLFDEPKR